MSTAHWVLIGILSIFILFTIPINSVYAENATPYNEWDFDFDFSKVAIYQNNGDLHELVIKVRVLYDGIMPLGTVNVDALVTSPSGEESPHFGQLRDMKPGEIKSLRLIHGMADEGIYIIKLKMTPPSEPFQYHIFDDDIIEFEVPRYGFEKLVQIVGDDAEQSVVYKMENPLYVKYNESVHVVIDLPEQHTFEKIIVMNDEFVKDFPINTKEIFIDSQTGYRDLQVHLVKQDFIIPPADAQNTIHDFVKFYKISEDECSSLNCLNITIDKSEEKFQWWIVFVSIVIVIIVVFLMRKKKLDNKSNPNKETDETGYLTKIKSPY